MKFITTPILYWSGLLLLGLIWGVTPTLAQPASLRGYVTDTSDGTPMQGVNVVLQDRFGHFYGAATTRDGFFVLTGISPGTYALRVSFIGYQTLEDSLYLAPELSERRNLELSPDETELNTLVVEGENLGGATNVSAGLQTVRPRDIDLVPAPSISGDLATYLTTLPGVITTGDQGGQFFIRGGEASQNLILVDGMLVYQPFHMLGFYSAFPTDIINQVDFYAGGYGSRYGGRLSSVMDIATRNGNKRRVTGAATVSPFVSSIRIEGPTRLPRILQWGPLVLLDERSSLLVSFRQSLLGIGASNLVDDPLPFVFNDFYAKLHTQFTNSQLSISALRTYDRGTIGIDSPERPADDLRWWNEAYGTRYIYAPPGRPLLFELGVSMSRLTSEFGPGSFPSRFSLAQRYNSFGHFTYFVPRADIQWGMFARTLRVESDLGGLFQGVFRSREFLTEAGLYLEPELRLRSDIRVIPGLRIHAFPSKERYFLEPRLRAVWDRGGYQFDLAAGIYHQNIVGLNDRRDASGVFTAWRATPFKDIPRALHLITGYHLRLGDGWEWSVETYYKRLSNLFVAEWTAFPRFTTQLQQARGRVYGLDLRMEMRRPRFYGYITYGLSSVEYEGLQESLPLWYGVESLKFRPGHDRRHQINVLGSTSWRRFDVQMRWQFGSGLPYSRAFGFDGFVLMDDAVDLFDRPGSRRVIYERPFNGVLPTYHRLDVSIERTILRSWGELVFQLSMLNVYNRRNLFFLDVFTLQREDQLPFIPSFGMKVEFE